MNSLKQLLYRAVLQQASRHPSSDRLAFAARRKLSVSAKLSVGMGLDEPASGRAGRPFLGSRSSSDPTPPLTTQQARRETWRLRPACEQGGSGCQRLWPALTWPLSLGPSGDDVFPGLEILVGFQNSCFNAVLGYVALFLKLFVFSGGSLLMRIGSFWSSFWRRPEEEPDLGGHTGALGVGWGACLGLLRSQLPTS